MNRPNRDEPLTPKERTEWRTAVRIFEACLKTPEMERKVWLEARDLDPGTRQKFEFMLHADTALEPSLEQGKDWIIREANRIRLEHELEGRRIDACTLDQKVSGQYGDRLPMSSQSRRHGPDWCAQTVAYRLANHRG
ncbi:MAG: hypothetical protein AAF446_06745 [Pseudomonadota bacterium]